MEEARQAKRRRQATWEANNRAARHDKRRARAAEGHVELRRPLSWSDIDCTVDGMFTDTCFHYPLPADTRLSALFRQIKNLYLHIFHAFDSAPSDWFVNTSNILLRSRGMVLEDHIAFLQTVLRRLQPYFRAMDITYDTYGIFFSNDDVWGREVVQMADDVHTWAADIRKILDAWDGGTLKHVLSA
ncbi:hypothetical protein CYLTODRAFT_495393 [Cylindrobasidium torrendii FP15055 ss-10]|uniref:Uncharacterized protein n=1 Tax=Cylindrobasidium torrendii FP15055 ss-10 TaxID=1314674 RepID=A0A0D7ATH3_9AGAR|nr:hypothetical protein CYLTODRAFT_495393 [Cylindrobasidium torrendii FP15055 ss-10]